MADQVIFYDLASRQGKGWSLNPWKGKSRMLFNFCSTCWEFSADDIPARLVLNYKNIPYETEWLEYPDLRPTFEKL